MTQAQNISIPLDANGFPSIDTMKKLMNNTSSGSQSASRPTRIVHIDSSNAQTPYRSSEDLEKIRVIEKELRVIIMSSIALFMCSKWRETIKMVLEKGKNKDGYTPLRDYSIESKAVEICKTMNARISRFYDDLYKMQDTIYFNGKSKVDDPIEYWAMQTDTASRLFDNPFRKCLASIYAIFRRTLRPEDPVMFSQIIKLTYISGLYTNVFDSFARIMDANEVKPFRKLAPIDNAFDLSKHLHLRDEEGKIIAFAYYAEADAVKQQIRTKKFYLGHKSEEYRIIYPAEIYQCEDVAKIGYELERYMYDFKTISKIRESAGLPSIDYRKIYKMDRDVPCLETFAQYQVCAYMQRFEYKKALSWLDEFENSIPLYRGKKTTPVVAVMINPKPTKSSPGTLFKGIWNSAGEASRETNERYMTIVMIRKSNDCKKRIENGQWEMHNNFIWMSLSRFRTLLKRLVAEKITL